MATPPPAADDDQESRERSGTWRDTISTVSGVVRVDLAAWPVLSIILPPKRCVAQVWNNLPALRANDGEDGSIGLRALGCAEILKVSSVYNSPLGSGIEGQTVHASHHEP